MNTYTAQDTTIPFATVKGLVQYASSKGVTVQVIRKIRAISEPLSKPSDSEVELCM